VSEPQAIPLPAAIREWLVAYVEQAWPEPAAVVAALPEALPAGEVRRLASGGPFGLMLAGRLDEVDGRLALEALENSRMSGEVYFRVWDDGGREALEPAPRTGYTYKDEEERPAAEAEYLAHNRAAYEHLRRRGFM